MEVSNEAKVGVSEDDIPSLVKTGFTTKIDLTAFGIHASSILVNTD